MSDWIVVCKPQEVRSADGKNMGGIVVLLRKGDKYLGDSEVARVAYDRTNSKNPRVSFDIQVKKVQKKAHTAVDVLNMFEDPDEGALE